MKQPLGLSKLDIVPTWRCQLACEYCYNRGKATPDGRDDSPRDMSPDVQDAAIDLLMRYRPAPVRKQHRMFGFTWYGGEPTLCPDIIDRMNTRLRGAMTEAGVKAAVRNAMASNFVHLSPEFKRCAHRWDVRMQVSCDGQCGQGIQRRLPNGDNPYEQVLSNAKWYSSWRGEPSKIRMTITPRTVEHMASDIRDLWERGIADVTAMPSWDDPWTPATLRTLYDQTEAVGELILEAFAAGKPLVTKWLVDPFRRWSRNWTKPASHCGAGRGMVAVEPNGNIWPCHRFSGHDPADDKWGRLCMGNVLEGTLDEPQWFAMNNIDSIRDGKQDCAACECYPFCSLSCIYMSYAMTGDLFETPTTYCDYHRFTFALARRINYRLNERSPRLWRNAWQVHVTGRGRRSRPCIHRGAEQDPVECKQCQGSVKIKTFACAVHERCTPSRKSVDGIVSCPTCKDRNHAKPTPDPQPAEAVDATAAA